MSARQCRSEKPVLEVSGLSVTARNHFGVDLKDVSFDVHGGEIVGLAGVSGNGQAELDRPAQRRTHARPKRRDQDLRNRGGAARSGRAPQARRRLRPRGAARTRRGAIAYAVGERRADRPTASAPSATDWSTGRRPARSPRTSSTSSRSRPTARNRRRKACRAAICKNSSSDARSRCKPKLLLVSQPTWGVDVGAAAFIRQTLVDLSRAGAAVLVVSEELDELFEICDRLLVICKGRVSAPLVRTADGSRGSRLADDRAERQRRRSEREWRSCASGLNNGRSRPPLMRIGAPIVATVLTLIVGSIFFAVLGHDPLATLHAFFVAPLNSMNGLSEWLLKASPLILIACGLAVGFRANVWNIGAEGQLIIGAIAASGVGLFWPNPESSAAVAADVPRRHGRRHGLGGNTGFLARPHEHQRNPGHADADLYRDAVPVLSGARAVARSGRLQLSADRTAAGCSNARAVRLCLPAQPVDLHHRRRRRW